MNFYKAAFTGSQNQWDTQTHWNLTHRQRARDLYSRAKPCSLCFFYEALCGWEEPKNNLHNMVEKKLIPQPHLLLWVRLLIYRFMTGCVFIATSRCICASSQGKGKVLVWGWERSKLTNNTQRELLVEFPHPASLLLQHCSSHCSLFFIKHDTGGPNAYYLLRDQKKKNRLHEAVLYYSWQLRGNSSLNVYSNHRKKAAAAHTVQRETPTNSWMCRHGVTISLY